MVAHCSDERPEVVRARDLVDFSTSLVDSACGVPCSTLWPWIMAHPNLMRSFRSAPNEGEAVAYAAGVWLGGGSGMVLMQSSGIGNAVNALTSLLAPFQIPVLMLVGWRGAPGVVDEAHHRPMGTVTTEMLRLCGIDAIDALSERAPMAETYSQIRDGLKMRRSSALLFSSPSRERHMALRAEPPRRSVMAQTCVAMTSNDDTVRPCDVIQACVEHADVHIPIVASTGYCCRDLYVVGDRPNNFYMTGSMGHAASLALGVAERTKQLVIVLDGDGALLMRLGVLAMIGARPDTPIVHVVLKNGVHESTGGQETVLKRSASLAALAAECGYATSTQCGSLTHVRDSLRCALSSRESSFIEVRTSRRAAEDRPRVNAHLPDLALRFRQCFGSRSVAIGRLQGEQPS